MIVLMLALQFTHRTDKIYKHVYFHHSPIDREIGIAYAIMYHVSVCVCVFVPCVCVLKANVYLSTALVTTKEIACEMEISQQHALYELIRSWIDVCQNRWNKKNTSPSGNFKPNG